VRSRKSFFQQVRSFQSDSNDGGRLMKTGRKKWSVWQTIRRSRKSKIAFPHLQSILRTATIACAAVHGGFGVDSFFGRDGYAEIDALCLFDTSCSPESGKSLSVRPRSVITRSTLFSRAPFVVTRSSRIFRSANAASPRFAAKDIRATVGSQCEWFGLHNRLTRISALHATKFNC